MTNDNNEEEEVPMLHGEKLLVLLDDDGGRRVEELHDDHDDHDHDDHDGIEQVHRNNSLEHSDNDSAEEKVEEEKVEEEEQPSPPLQANDSEDQHDQVLDDKTRPLDVIDTSSSLPHAQRQSLLTTTTTSTPLSSSRTLSIQSGSGASKHIIRRMSRTQSIDSGIQEVKELQVEVLVGSQYKPMNKKHRRKKELQHKLFKGKSLFKAAAETVLHETKQQQQQQQQDVVENEHENTNRVRPPMSASERWNLVSDNVRNTTRRGILKRNRTTTTSEEPAQFHGRLQVQTSLPYDFDSDNGNNDDEDDNGSCSSSNGSSGGSSSNHENLDKITTSHRQSQLTTTPLNMRAKKHHKTKRGQQPQQQQQRPHYRLALNKAPQGNICVRTLRAFGMSAGSNGIYDNVGNGTTGGGLVCCGFRPNQIMTLYLHWTFRASFFAYFLSAALNYLCLTVVFALLIWSSGTNHPQCIHVNGEDFGYGGGWKNFMDAYALSWTTFSTVGYGLVFPSTSAVVRDHRDCVGIAILTTLESFIGILFASLTGAIVFSKITRVRSQAQVTFSDPIVIKYGSGVVGDRGDEWSSTINSGGGNNNNKTTTTDKLNNNHNNAVSPFPVLEFRVVNRLHSALKGEIMDCVMNVVASVDATNADANFRRDQRQNAAGLRRRKGKKRGVRPPLTPKKGSTSSRTQQSPSLNTGLTFKKKKQPQHKNPTTINETKTLSLSELQPSTKSLETSSNASNTSVLSPMNLHSPSPPKKGQRGRRRRRRTRRQSTFDEEIGGNKLVPRRIFSKLEMDGGPDHPFFKRVWTARHVLDHHSPLLTREARRQVRLNDNYWPPEMNTHQAVRAAISFDQILVSFSGTSNVDANSVYAQKVYEFGDVNVGYTFATMLYRDMGDGSLKCDLTLLNNVFEQAGGGGEPFRDTQHDQDDNINDHLSEIVVL